MFPARAGAVGGVVTAAMLASAAFPDTSRKARVKLGLLTYSLALAQKASATLPHLPKLSDPLVFIQQAAHIGANAVQIPFGVLDEPAIRKIRDQAAQLGVGLESTVGLPRAEADSSRFEAELRTLQELGVAVVRTVIFPGRRYEDLHSYADYQRALDEARARLRRAEPLAKRFGIRLAVENHKDQRIDERVGLLEEFSSERIGACLDVGNNIALLENPVEVTRALAPWTLTVHFKDQGVREYEEGFLLADVPLGQGCIDLPEIVQVIREKQPGAHLQLELITRDALRVPVLKESYWPTFPGVRARALSDTWGMIKAHGSPASFPMVSSLTDLEKVELERRNIEESFQFAAAHLGL